MGREQDLRRDWLPGNRGVQRARPFHEKRLAPGGVGFDYPSARAAKVDRRKNGLPHAGRVRDAVPLIVKAGFPMQDTDAPLTQR